jgi:hypothetical protein
MFFASEREEFDLNLPRITISAAFYKSGAAEN